jgi:hypothetical protein
MIVTANLARLALCPCGDSVLRESVELGTEYLIDDGRTLMATYECGACGSMTVEVECVRVRRPGTPWGYLPRLLFEQGGT